MNSILRGYHHSSGILITQIQEQEKILKEIGAILEQSVGNDTMKSIINE